PTAFLTTEGPSKAAIHTWSAGGLVWGLLNMSHYSLDDKYKGCLWAMQSNLTSLIRSELNASDLYNEAWNRALLIWQSNQFWLYPRNMKELASVAVYAYTLGYPPLYIKFNAATRIAGKSLEEYKAYPFKSLHFLLTWATLTFRPRDLKCVKVYRGTSVEFTVNDLFRFGQFTSTSESLAVAKRFEAVTLFKLFTCKGIEISDMSNYEEEEEVLVPPYEIFKITSVKNTSVGKIVQAKSVGTCSYHNCAFVGKAIGQKHRGGAT
uniref:NAD(P)(+)--arginine ADP-ribosyltransferase n=1 Tax=Salvator merianae TaxID=96440 RepID=A0A8D0BBR7_SALMN